MPRFSVPEADAILDVVFPVLDKGHVILVDYCGNDQRIVDSARVSYSSGKKLRDNIGLINYLMKNDHTSPFEQVSFTFMFKMPVFVCRQFFRHRMFKFNEVSGRYSEMKDEMYVPAQKRIQKQSRANKQGSDGILEGNIQAKIQHQMQADQIFVFGSYKEYLDRDVAKELARINLPLSLYTELYCTADLRNLFNFLKLRLDAHAQWEIQQYGLVMADIVKKACPIAYQAFEDHILNSVKISYEEVKIMKLFFNRELFLANLNACQDEDQKKLMESLYLKIYNKETK